MTCLTLCPAARIAVTNLQKRMLTNGVKTFLKTALLVQLVSMIELGRVKTAIK